MKIGLIVCLLALTTLAWAKEGRLAEKIDALLPQPSAADDAEFLRRVWLDFDGGIPTADVARVWLADQSPDKRTRLIDKLMGETRFALRMAEAFHVMLMERRGENEEWKTWLVECFKTNQPWDAMVREMLAPDFLDEKQRGASYFLTRRLEKLGQQDTDYAGLTRDVGRMFMGIDLQCCQCHRHLTVSDYKQIDFSGLYAVFQNLKLQPVDDKHKIPWLSEGLINAKYEFVSVFTEKKSETAPRIPFGEEVMIPVFTGDDGWLVKPDRKIKEVGQPKFSPLREVAQRIPTPENALFAKNIANRVWFLFIGKGLVEPLDLHHSENPPMHPELLELLGREFTAHQFDLRFLIREIALTQVYQRAGAHQRHLLAEQKLRAFLTATGERERLEKNQKADPNVDSAKYALADFEKAFTAALANPAKEPELAANPSLRSALFFRNSDHVYWALRPRAGNLIDRLAKLPDPAGELYLATLTRQPSDAEKADLQAWLAAHGGDRSKALSDYAWALLSSTEFFVNH